MSFNPLTSILAAGGINFKGVWNASTNTPVLMSGVGDAGDYYIVGEAGATVLDGVSPWDVNDWAVFNGSAWQKVNSEDQSQLSHPETVIFRPGASSLSEPGVYGTWLGVMAYVATLSSPVEVIFDSSITNPCVIPTGTHTFPVGSKFRGSMGPVNVQVEIDDGAVLVGVTTFEEGLTLISNSNSPLMTVTGANTLRLVFSRGVQIRCDGAGPFLRVTGASASATAIFYDAEWLSGTAPVMDVTSNGSAVVMCFVSAEIGLNTLAGEVSTSITVNLSPNTILNPTQTGVLGLYTLLLTYRAKQALFDPTVLSSQLVATDVQAAIDELTLKHNNKLAQTISSPGTVNISALSARLILVDMTSAGSTPLDINLPAISADSGPWMFKRLDSNTASSVKIYGTGGNTIDLLPFQVLSGWPASMHLVSGPSNWYRI